MIELAVIIAILGWGSSAIFAGKAVRNGEPLAVTAWTPIIAAPILLIPLIAGVNFSPSKELLQYAALSAIVLFCAWLMYFFALQKGDTSPVAAVGSAYPIFSFAIFIVFGSASLKTSVFLGIFLIATGLFLMQAISSKSGRVGRASLLLAICSSIAWGLWGFLDYKALQYGTPFDLMFWTQTILIFLAIPVLVSLRIKKRPVKIEKEVIFYRLGASFNSSIALLAFYFALSKTTSPAEIVAITATYPIITMCLAILFKEELFYPKRALAVAVVVLGVAILHL